MKTCPLNTLFLKDKLSVLDFVSYFGKNPTFTSMDILCPPILEELV